MPSGLDASVADLQDHGFYSAGAIAKQAYLSLSQYWRRESLLPTWMLAAPASFRLQVLTPLSASNPIDNVSSRLGILLAILQRLYRLPYDKIYATGNLTEDDAGLPIVAPIDSIRAKIDLILDDIKTKRSRQPITILIALPRRLQPSAFDPTNNNTAYLYQQRIDLTLGNLANVTYEVCYLDSITTDLPLIQPKLARYRRLRKVVKLLPLIAISVLLLWQYQQPLLIQWEAKSIYPNVDYPLSDTPQRARLQQDGQLAVQLPCSHQQVPVMMIDDILLMSTSVDDHSIYPAYFRSTPVAVLVGSESSIRIEDMTYQPTSSNRLGRSVYGLALSMKPPAEFYGLIVISRRGAAIDKGQLSNRLERLIAPMDALSRITTVEGYLDKHYATASYRFYLQEHQDCDH